MFIKSGCPLVERAGVPKGAGIALVVAIVFDAGALATTARPMAWVEKPRAARLAADPWGEC